MSDIDSAENGSICSATGSNASGDVQITEDTNFKIEPDTAFDDAINKLDELNLEPDSDIPEMTSGEADDTGSHGEDSDGSKDNKAKAKGVTIQSSKEDGKKPLTKSSKKASLFDRLKQLTKFEKKQKGTLDSNLSKFRGIKVDRLPVYFVAKYIGHMETKGVYGLEHVRGPVDEFIAKVKDDLVSMDRVELPLCYVVFSPKGIDVREHPSNKVKEGVSFGLHPIDFISYGVQDMKYWRVFSFIVVNELGYKKKKTECHAFIADSTQNARKMALALGACFSVYKKKLRAEGKAHNFQVELRPPDELAGDLQNDVDA
ncbi:uncharacterized protein LOC123561171 [Mercenaria mercenaria]|uniref:uncharacterized protein LOC123561171 n=1 Tax=Mercenaria mercenaria TaxID=6596 RepID=UPI00234E45A4|nr:uncharacterized protein LOC123561171 [Mercenaria mercenaria]